MSTIATICARGGSTGLPGKNTRLLLGKPLIEYSIEQARATPGIDGVFVSTDSAEIARIARLAGAEVPFIRPRELATNEAPKIPVIQHLVSAVEKLGVPVNRIVDLDPTSPLRDLSDIEACLALLTKDINVVITAFEADKNPYFNMIERKFDGKIGLVKSSIEAIASRQSAPKVYSMNASIYVWHRQTLTNNLWSGNVALHLMPRHRSIDIDSILDFHLVELLMREKHG